MTGIRAVAVIVCIAVTLAGCGGSPATTRTTHTDRPRRPARRAPRCTRTWVRSPATCGPATWTASTPTGPCRACSRVRPAGEAATWIGAEAPGPRRGAPFVQVGVNEGNTDAGSRPFYYAFYSTTSCTSTPSTCSTCHPAIRSRRRCAARRALADRVHRPYGGSPAAAVGGRGGRTAIQRGAVHPGGRHRRAHGPAVSVSEPVPGPFHRGRRRRGGAAAGPADARAG